MKVRRGVLILVGLLLVLVAALACAKPTAPSQDNEKVTITFTSPSFKSGGRIPTEFTCQGQNVSPPLEWDQVPAGTASFALIVDDLDAPLRVYTHWVIFNLPPEARSLPRAVANTDALPDGALQGKNSAGRTGYAGPCPPAGIGHRYRFWLYALDGYLNLTAGASKQELLEAMQGHVLAEGHLLGLYQR